MPKKKKKPSKKSSRALLDIKEAVKKQQLSRKLYELPSGIKEMIFQFAMIANMADWCREHATKSKGILWSISKPSRRPLISRYVITGRHQLAPRTICANNEYTKHSRESFIPDGYLLQKVTTDRFRYLENHRNIDCFGDGDVYWYDKRCMCKDCYDVFHLGNDYQKEMRHWFIKHMGFMREFSEKCADFSEGREKRDKQLDIIDNNHRRCTDETPPHFYEYRYRNYKFDESQFTYVPR